jgi:hypothetical protein
MFVIIYGTKIRKELLGTVADHCPQCGRPQAFSVYDYFAVSHVYYISLSRGKHSGSWRQCGNCQTWLSCQPDAYDTLLPWQTARGLSVDDLLQRTNTRFLRRRQNEQLWQEYRGRPLDSEDDTPARLALGRMRDHGLDENTMLHFQDRLIGWLRLAPEARSRLLQEIDGAILQQQIRAQAAALVAAATQHAPANGVGCMPTLAACVALIFLACLAVPYINQPRHEHNWMVLFAFFGVMGLILVTIYLRLQRAAYVRFFRDRLIAPAEAAGIDLGLICEAVQSIQRWGTQREEVVAMLNYQPILHELVREKAPLDDQEIASLSNGSLPIRRVVVPLIVMITMVSVLTAIVNAIVKHEVVKEDEAQWVAAAVQPFEQRLQEFIHFDPANMPHEENEPQIRGRLLAIDVTADKRVADIHVGLPLDLRAHTPEQVGTIAWLAFSGIKVGQYPPNIDAIQQTCHVTLIDKQRGVIIAEHDFKGGDPPVRLNGNVNYGSKPERAVIEWLSALPRR